MNSARFSSSIQALVSLRDAAASGCRLLTWCVLAAVLVGAGCTSSRLYVAEEHRANPTPELPTEKDLTYEVFLIGDSGLFVNREVPEEPLGDPVFGLLQRKLAQSSGDGAVVFLGDNIYCCGMPDSSHRRRSRAERIIRVQMETVEDYEGQVFFIPGNHDWNPRGARPWEAVWRQEAFIERRLDRGNIFVPDSTRPGPVEIELKDDLTLVVLDTQWWVESAAARRGSAGTSPALEEGQVLLELDDIIQRNRGNHVLVAGHHPMYSIGRHAGYFPWRTHLFPLTELRADLYLPLPGVGSLYPLYRRFIGSPQDLPHARYARMRRAFTTIFQQHDHLVYAAGHDHNLQYFRQQRQHYLVSGAGSYPRPVARGRGAEFTYAGHGFLSLKYYEDGSVWLEAWGARAESAPDGRLLYRDEITPPADPAGTAPSDTPSDRAVYRDSSITRAVNPSYQAGSIRRFFLGSHNRYAWAAPVTAPLFHARKIAGGLTPLKRTGSAQTPGVRLRGAGGEEYVLRSIDKDPLRSLDEKLRETFVRDIRQDQTSTMHPFGAFLIPDLADALGIYHTNPKLYYVPPASGLGVYSPVLADRFALFEERPDEDVSAIEAFGRSEDAMSYRKVYRKINEDNDHRVDQWMYARARLFDLLLADWDRHPDQWRWVSFEPPDEQGKIYRPIPRDRDYAFFRLDGLFPWFVKTYILWEYQGFGRSYGNIKGLTENALLQDRRFTNTLERKDWRAIADSMQTALSDSVIDAAVDHWKEEYDPVRGDEIGEILKVRRDKLARAADRFYGLLAERVDVVGSRKHERFEVERLDDGRTQVRVYKMTKEQEVRYQIYERILYTSETRQIRLFGLDGRDQFLISGRVEKGPEIIAVGGPGPDRFQDNSRVAGLRRRTRFQDTGQGDEFTTGPETVVIRLDDPARNMYNPAPYRYDRTFPIGQAGYNIDDGLVVGGGARIVRQGFQQSPYAQLHRIEASAASRTGAVTAEYRGEFVSALRGFNVHLHSKLRAPNSVRNYYGLGNETPNTEASSRYYQVQFAQATLSTLLNYRTGEGLSVSAGPSLEYTDIAESASRFVGQPQSGVSPATFDDHLYVGLGAELNLRSLDNRLNPQQGFRWQSSAWLYDAIPGGTGTYGRLESTASLFVSPSLSPQVTAALRAGASTNVGEFPFYRANTLGGRLNLRGYRHTRFAGRSSVYQNVELRAEFSSFASYLGWGTLGVLGFLDNGRVWADGEDSDRWHQGYGGGLWISLYDRVVLTGTAAFSKENRTFTSRIGFMF